MKQEIDVQELLALLGERDVTIHLLQKQVVELQAKLPKPEGQPSK